MFLTGNLPNTGELESKVYSGVENVNRQCQVRTQELQEVTMIRVFSCRFVLCRRLIKKTGGGGPGRPLGKFPCLELPDLIPG